MTRLTTTIGALILTTCLSVTPVQAQTADELDRLTSFLTLINDYFAVIESTHSINENPEKAAILQMQKIQEVFEERGEKARSIEVLKSVLEQSRNQTIRNSAYFLLGDTLKETGRHDEAIQMLEAALAENIKVAEE